MSSASKAKVIMTNISGRGGIAQYSYCLATALAKCDIDLLYLVPHGYEFSLWEHPFRVKVLFEQLFDKGSLLKKGITHLRNVRKLKYELTYHHPRICHLHQVKLPWVDCSFVRWCHRNDVAVVYTAHNILHLERQIGMKVLGDFYQEVDAIIVHAENNKKEICETFGVDWEKVAVIPHGNFIFYRELPYVKELDQRKARRNLGLDVSKRVILFFGNIREYKGLDVLLEAYNYLEQRGQEFSLLIAGKTIENFRKYQAIIDRSNSSTIYTHLHYIPGNKVSDYFLAADVVVLPYRHIYQSGVVQLAYAYARPVITTSVGGLTEVVEHGRSGMLVPPNDPKALAETINNLLEDSELLIRMGKFAYQLAKEKYSWNTIGQKTVMLYEKVVQHDAIDKFGSKNSG